MTADGIVGITLLVAVTLLTIYIGIPLFRRHEPQVPPAIPHPNVRFDRPAPKGFEKVVRIDQRRA